ncbi:MAG: inorganic diphosphatase [Verrucomicrobiota bacterium]|nr:MAG: inorganic diphosphatase [Verrucomicrobiota bacterium]
MNDTSDYWQTLEQLIRQNGVTIDRPKGTAHPRFPDRIYPINYGYIPGTYSADGEGIDVFLGTKSEESIQGIICTFDDMKRDAEIKVLYRCTEAEIQIASRLLSHPPMHSLLILRDRTL